MISLIVIDGDRLKFSPKFGDRTVTIIDQPVIKGSGQATVMNKKVCIAGDEKKVALKATYYTDVYKTPGTGVVTISELDSSQEAPGCTSGAALITKGSTFKAKFTPEVLASSPGSPPPTDQPSPSQGEGEFITQQDFSMAGTP
jgi:hypothetical protein